MLYLITLKTYTSFRPFKACTMSSLASWSLTIDWTLRRHLRMCDWSQLIDQITYKINFRQTIPKWTYFGSTGLANDVVNLVLDQLHYASVVLRSLQCTLAVDKQSREKINRAELLSAQTFSVLKDFDFIVRWIILEHLAICFYAKGKIIILNFW